LTQPRRPSTPGRLEPTRELPSLDEIRRRAHELYLDRLRRGADGSPQDDWLRAERELMANGARPH
jgi:hypothetical protein